MSNAKVYISVGHGGKDSGAVGYCVEKDVNLVMALACRSILIQHGVDVKMSRTVDEDDPLIGTIKEVNAWNPDLAIDCHNNAGRGQGFEVFYFSGGGTSLQLAKNIESEVVKIGQNSRGCKTKLNDSGLDYFGFIRQTICPAVICEGFFVDNETDYKKADTEAKQKEFGYAYAKGILKTLGIEYQTVDSTDTENYGLYHVQVGAYSKRENAEEQLKKVREAGFLDSFIKKY